MASQIPGRKTVTPQTLTPKAQSEPIPKREILSTGPEAQSPSLVAQSPGREAQSPETKLSSPQSEAKSPVSVPSQESPKSALDVQGEIGRRHLEVQQMSRQKASKPQSPTQPAGIQSESPQSPKKDAGIQNEEPSPQPTKKDAGLQTDPTEIKPEAKKFPEQSHDDGRVTQQIINQDGSITKLTKLPDGYGTVERTTRDDGTTEYKASYKDGSSEYIKQNKDGSSIYEKHDKDGSNTRTEYSSQSKEKPTLKGLQGYVKNAISQQGQGSADDVSRNTEPEKKHSSSGIKQLIKDNPKLSLLVAALGAPMAFSLLGPMLTPLLMTGTSLFGSMNMAGGYY